MSTATRNDLQARFFRASLRGLSTGNTWFPASPMCRGAGNKTRRANQSCRWSGGGTRRNNHVRYFLYNHRILFTGKVSLWGSAMPTLLVAAPPDAPRASERRCNYASTGSSRLYPISSGDQDTVRPSAGPQCQYGVRCRYRPTPRMFGSKVRPSPVGEDRRQYRSIPRTPDRCHNKCLGPYRSVQTLIRQTIPFFSSN